MSVAAQMNCSFAILQRELLGLVNLGDGALKFSADDVKLFLLIPSLSSQEVENTFMKLACRDMLDIPPELEQPDRRALDEMVFDVLGLTQGERDAVYEAVVNLVSSRLSKAESV